jgi:tRNA threonylcarbamoyladenosine biosynthesis protein TsaE|tara:strand:- start:646 stop:1062 length:417 start_codon:yes stop_codon:yes gene_type:complete
MKFENLEIKDYDRVSEYILCNNYSNIFLFYGEMGSGKTTLIQSLCRNIGVFDKVLSPTFSIINEYQIKNKSLLYHFDFYRIKTIDELVEIGFDEYVYSNKICFIEWPQIAMKLIPRKFIKIKIDINKNLKRNINITMN